MPPLGMLTAQRPEHVMEPAGRTLGRHSTKLLVQPPGIRFIFQAVPVVLTATTPLRRGGGLPPPEISRNGKTIKMARNPHIKEKTQLFFFLVFFIPQTKF